MYLKQWNFTISQMSCFRKRDNFGKKVPKEIVDVSNIDDVRLFTEPLAILYAVTISPRGSADRARLSESGVR